MDLAGKYTETLPRALPWEVRVGQEVFTPQQPGSLKGDITLDYNSVGACVGGQLTFEGYVDWRPYSEYIQVLVEGKSIGLGVIGIPQSTRSETGKRTTQVPIVGLHALDADGLAALGLGSAFPEVGVSGGVELWGVDSPLSEIPTEVRETDALGFETVKTVMNPPPFGETVNAGLQRMFKDNPLASWGVRPDGRRVAGIPSGGTSLSSTALNVRAQPANYELTSYISEFAERPAERWKPEYHARQIGHLMPRHSATVSSDELLADSCQEAPLSLSVNHFDDKEATNGYLVATVNLRELVEGSLNNPKAQDVTYQPEGISVTVQVTFDHPPLDSAPPSGWKGHNVYLLGTWQDNADIQPLTDTVNRINQGRNALGWGELWDYINWSSFPYLTTTQDSGTKDIKSKDKDYWSMVALDGWNVGLSGERGDDYEKLVAGFPDYFDAIYPKKVTDEAQKQWELYQAQVGVNIVYSEWLTKSQSDQAQVVIYEAAPVQNNTQPAYNPPNDKDSFSEALTKLGWYYDPKNYQASNAQLDLDPKKDPGLLKGLYKNNVRLYPDMRRVLTWTFTVPKELLGQLDPSLGTDYKWAFGLAFSGIRLGLKARGKVMSSVYYSKIKAGSTNIAKDLPAFDMQTFTTPTLQGQVLGEIHTGPFTVDGQQMANAKIVISKESWYTEFQTGAPNGGR